MNGEELGGGSVRIHRMDIQKKIFLALELTEEELEAKFVAEALKNDLAGLKGHRSVGGCRASIYNATTKAGVQALVDFMKDFAKKNG